MKKPGPSYNDVLKFYIKGSPNITCQTEQSIFSSV